MLFKKSIERRLVAIIPTMAMITTIATMTMVPTVAAITTITTIAMIATISAVTTTWHDCKDEGDDVSGKKKRKRKRKKKSLRGAFEKMWLSRTKASNRDGNMQK